MTRKKEITTMPIIIMIMIFTQSISAKLTPHIKIMFSVFLSTRTRDEPQSMIMRCWKWLHWHDTAKTPQAVISDRNTLQTLSIVTNIYKTTKFEPHVITQQHGSQITVIFTRTWLLVECARQDIQQIWH